MISLILAFLVLPFMTQTTDYSALRTSINGIEVIRLKDTLHNMEVSIVPSIGNIAYEINVNGKPVLWSPYRSLKELQEKPTMLGNPFLAPWANRIDGGAYWANGKKYLLNPELKNYRRDGNGNPIHGLLVYAREWEVIDIRAESDSASVTSRLEFWRRPDWMAQFPFAHSIEMTYCLKDGILEVGTAVSNLSAEAMPLSLGYHTYYRIEDSPRDDWRVHIPARDHVILSNLLIPTGEKEPVNLADSQLLRNLKLDDVFTNLVRDSAGLARFRLKGRNQQITVTFGPKYDVAVVYSPPGRDFLCFEPMAGITNAFNLAHAGVYRNLQSIPPGGTWKESFWIMPEGY